MKLERDRDTFHENQGMINKQIDSPNPHPMRKRPISNIGLFKALLFVTAPEMIKREAIIIVFLRPNSSLTCDPRQVVNIAALIGVAIISCCHINDNFI